MVATVLVSATKYARSNDEGEGSIASVPLNVPLQVFPLPEFFGAALPSAVMFRALGLGHWEVIKIRQLVHGFARFG